MKSNRVVDKKVIELAGRRVEVRMIETTMGAHTKKVLIPRVRYETREPVCVCGEPLSWHEKFEDGSCCMRGCTCKQFQEVEVQR